MNAPYRTFEKFPLVWKTSSGFDSFVQILVAVSIFLSGFVTGGLSASLPRATVPEAPPKPPPAMCYDTILTGPNDSKWGDDHLAYKCPFWDQSMHTITLKGQGAIACKCPNSKSVTP